MEYVLNVQCKIVLTVLVLQQLLAKDVMSLLHWAMMQLDVNAPMANLCFQMVDVLHVQYKIVKNVKML